MLRNIENKIDNINYNNRNLQFDHDFLCDYTEYYCPKKNCPVHSRILTNQRRKTQRDFNFIHGISLSPPQQAPLLQELQDLRLAKYELKRAKDEEEVLHTLQLAKLKQEKEDELAKIHRYKKRAEEEKKKLDALQNQVANSPSNRPEGQPEVAHPGAEAAVVEEVVDLKECVVCRDADKTIAFSPCGHIVTCSTCADKCSTCPICRGAITYRLKIYNI